MKNLVKKTMIQVGVLSLAVAFSVSLAGCGERPQDDDVFEYNPKIWHEDSVDKLTMFCNDWEQFNNGAAVKSPVYKELVKAAGTELKAKSTGSETYYTQLDLQRVNNELNELFIIDGPVNSDLYRSLIRDGEIIPISYYVNEASKDKYPYLYEYLQQYEYMKSNVTYSKGQLWFIPCEWSNDKSLYVRRDWIKNLNNKIDDILVADGVVSNKSQVTDALRAEYKFSEEGPEDLGEFYRLARAFTLYDPDGNGKNDTYGYVTEENRDMDSWIHAAFDTDWRMWTADENGTYHYSATSEGSMLATSFLNKMVSEGYVSSEVGVKTVSNKQDDFSQGKAGMMYAHNWYNVICANMMSATNGLTVQGAREKILITDPPAGKNGNFGGQGDVNYYRGWCIKEGMSVERLETCLNLMEYLHSPEGLELVTYGVFGEHWQWKDDVVGGERETLCEPDPQGFVQELRWTDPAAFAGYLTSTPPEAKALLTNGDILTARDSANRKNMKLSDYPDLYTESMTRYLAGAKDFFDQTVIKMLPDKALAADWTFDAKTWKEDWKTKLYTVSASMRNEWNEFVSEYNGAYFGAKMESEYNEAVKSGKLVKVGNN